MTSDTTTLRSEVLKSLRFPIVVKDILRKRRVMRRELLKQSNLVPTRVAILGGSTTSEIKSMLELFLLAQGIEPKFYESGYNRYSEEVEFENPDLWSFRPNIVLIHTTCHNISEFPELLEGETEVEHRVCREMARFTSLWEKIHTEL